jgi:mRNA interferase YafQ
MRRIERTKTFKRDYKRVKATPKHRDAETLLRDVLQLLAADLSLPERSRDHALSGEWKDHRDCHLKPDLILIYRNPTRRSCSSFASARIAILVSKRPPPSPDHAAEQEQRACLLARNSVIHRRMVTVLGRR